MIYFEWKDNFFLHRNTNMGVQISEVLGLRDSD